MPEILNRVGEIIEASTAEFAAQCYELYESPPLGGLVKTGDGAEAQYGIVYNVTTSSIEPGRRPIARGKDEAREEDIYRSSPQLAKLLRTEFSALVIGHKQGGSLLYYLPARPARIHSFVYVCKPEEIKEFSRSFGFLSILVNAQLPVPIEEITAACLRQMSQQADDPRAFLVAAGKELTVLLGSDFNRLKAILGRIRQ